MSTYFRDVKMLKQDWKNGPVFYMLDSDLTNSGAKSAIEESCCGDGVLAP